MNDKGDYKSSVKFFLSGYGLSDEDLDAMLEAPGGDIMLNCAAALPYDYAMLGDGLVPTHLATLVKVPTLILAAKEEPETAQALSKAISNARFQPMKASVHELSPSDGAKQIISFL